MRLSCWQPQITKQLNWKQINQNSESIVLQQVRFVEIVEEVFFFFSVSLLFFFCYLQGRFRGEEGYFPSKVVTIMRLMVGDLYHLHIFSFIFSFLFGL